MNISPAPKLSFVIPTLNSAATLGECLAAICNQNVPRATYEIIIADAGSSDATREIAQRFGVDHIVDNPLKTGEAGKSAGIHAARGELIALVDSDNILPDATWLAAMLAPFEHADIVAAEPLEYARRGSDPALTRYFALLGMNDPLCLFLGNYDRLCHITGTWTGLNVPVEDRGNFLALDCDPLRMPTIGANGFIFRRAVLAHVQWTPYFFDIDVAQQMTAAQLGKIAKVKCGIVHLYCSRLTQFARKQNRRIRDFLFFSKQGAETRTYAWRNNTGLPRFIVATLLVVPLLVQQFRGMRRTPDRAWWYHVPVCVLTLWIYGAAVVLKKFGLLKGPAERKNWQK